jgi:hypothetical protein
MLAAINPVALSECGQRHSGRSQSEDRSRHDPVARFDHAYPGSADQSLARLTRRPSVRR